MADTKVSMEYDIDVGDVKSAQAAVESLKAATDKAADGAGKMEEATKKAGRGTANFGQTALETGRIVQDFAQGGIGGIINNLESLARALGGGPGLAGVATLAGVAFLTLRKPVGEFFSSLIDGSNQVPQATDALVRMTEELDASKKRLKELGEQQTLTNAELAEYKKLGGEVLEQEKALNVEREKRNALDAQRKKEAAPDAESQKAVSEAVKAAGGVDRVTADVLSARPGATNAAQAQLDQVMKEQDAAMKAAGRNPSAVAGVRKQFARQIAEAQATLAKALQEAQAGASDLVAKALQGDQGAIRDLDRSLPGRGFGRATTEGIARDKANLAAGEEQKKRDDAELARREKATAERRAAREKEEAAAQAEEDRDEANRAREERRQQEQEARRMG